MSVTGQERHTRGKPCPICGGHDGMPRGREVRCNGYTGTDGKWCFCSRIADGAHHEVGSPSGPLFVHLLRDEPLEHDTNITFHTAPKQVAEYNYYDGDALAYQVVRYEPKSFKQRRPNGVPGSWIWGTAGVPRVMYRAKEVAESEGVVFLVEGEKDADALAALGLQATTSSGGAKGSKPSHEAGRALLRDRDVCIIADNDEADGAIYRDAWVQALEGIAKSVRAVSTPKGKDAADYIESGATAGDFLKLWADAANAVPSYAMVSMGPSELGASLGPVPWLCQPMRLAPGPVTLVAGEPGSGKTYGLQAVALAVASGRLLFDVWKCEHGPAKHFDYEQGPRLTHARYNEIAHGMGVTWADLDPKRSLRIEIMPTIFMRGLEDVDIWCRALDGYKFAIVDSFRRCCQVKDENAPEAARPLEAFWRVSEKTGCVVGMVHHFNKAPVQGKRKAIDRIAGTAAIVGMSQDAWSVERADAADAPSRWKHIRSRFPGSREEGFELRGKWVPYLAEPLGSLKFTLAPLGQADAEARRAEIEARQKMLLDFVRKNRGKTGRALAGLLGRSKSQVADDLAELENAGDVSAVPGPRNGKLWMAT